MPYIDCKITEKITETQKEEIKSELGRAVAIMRKPESYLMVGIADGYDLYFAGKKLEKGAFVAVNVFGKVAPKEAEKMTAEVCAILKNKLGIDGGSVYVTYQGYSDWGWNGGNF